MSSSEKDTPTIESMIQEWRDEQPGRFPSSRWTLQAADTSGVPPVLLHPSQKRAGDFCWQRGVGRWPQGCWAGRADSTAARFRQL